MGSIVSRPSIVAVDPVVLDEIWRRRPLHRLQSEVGEGRLAAYLRILIKAGADEGGPLGEAVREVDAATARAVFEALCETIGEGIWDVPGWTLRPLVDIKAILARGRTPYPEGLEPDGFSTPELYVWLDGREGETVRKERERLGKSHTNSIPPGEDPVLAEDIREHIHILLEEVEKRKLLLLVEHPHGL